MSGEERHMRSDSAMRDWNSSISRCCSCRSDAGDELKLQACRSQGLRFFAAAAEQERIAALETHHILTRLCRLNE